MFIYRASRGDEARKRAMSATSACLFFPTLTSSVPTYLFFARNLDRVLPLRRRASSVRCPENKRLPGSLNCSGLGVVMSNCIVVQWSFVDRECKTVNHFNRSLVSPWCWPLRCPPSFQLCERQRELNPCRVECHQRHHAFCSWCLSSCIRSSGLGLQLLCIWSIKKGTAEPKKDSWKKWQDCSEPTGIDVTR